MTTPSSAVPRVGAVLIGLCLLASAPTLLSQTRVTNARLLKPGGWFACEHADVQGESAPGVFTASGAFTEVRDNADLAGRPRFTTGRRV